MSNALMLTIGDNGEVQGLYSELLPLNSIGIIKNIERWSNIEFNNETELWDVFVINEGLVKFSHTSREECVRWEHQYYKETRENEK